MLQLVEMKILMSTVFTLVNAEFKKRCITVLPRTQMGSTWREKLYSCFLLLSIKKSVVIEFNNSTGPPEMRLFGPIEFANTLSKPFVKFLGVLHIFDPVLNLGPFQLNFDENF